MPFKVNHTRQFSRNSDRTQNTTHLNTDLILYVHDQYFYCTQRQEDPDDLLRFLRDASIFTRGAMNFFLIIFTLLSHSPCSHGGLWSEIQVWVFPAFFSSMTRHTFYILIFIYALVVNPAWPKLYYPFLCLNSTNHTPCPLLATTKLTDSTLISVVDTLPLPFFEVTRELWPVLIRR